MTRKKALRVTCIGLFILILAAAFYNGLVVSRYSIHSDKLAVGDSVRIVLISDLHSSIYGEKQSRLISLIKRQKPDIIVLAGDIADDVEPLEGTRLFLTGIQGMAPIYFVTGNHEYWSNDIENIKNTIRKYGVAILENRYERIRVKNSSILIGGVDDPAVARYEKPDFDLPGEMAAAFSEARDKSDFKILIAHRPELIEFYKKYGFDLVLSGHAHGGQVRIPLILNGLLAPNQGWFPKYAGGLYKHNTLTHIVSRGLSYNPRLPRVFNPPEIVVIDIARK